MKEKYTAPAVEIIVFDTEDVITTSLTQNAGIANDFPQGGKGDLTIDP